MNTLPVLSDTILEYLESRMGSVRFHRSLRRWLRRLWGIRVQEDDDLIGWLGTIQLRDNVGIYLPGPRWRTLFTSDFFLRNFYCCSVQELRPLNYASRSFGLTWVNAQKVLRKPPGRPQDGLLQRWQYHRLHIRRHGDVIDHLATSAAIEKLAALVAQTGAVAVVSAAGPKPLIDSGDELPNNALLDHYKALTDSRPFMPKRIREPALVH